jgi:hypothetical protein
LGDGGAWEMEGLGRWRIKYYCPIAFLLRSSLTP